MTDQDEGKHIETITTAVWRTLVKHKVDDYMDHLNSLTAVMVGIVMEKERLSKVEAFDRMSAVFAEHVGDLRRMAAKAKQH